MDSCGRATVELQGALTLPNAEAVHERLAAGLAQSAELTVDCSGATEADLTAIQLILGARRSAAARGGSLTLAEPARGPLLAALCQGGFITETGAETDDSRFWTAPSP